MTEHSLDSYENLYLDAISYRGDKARLQLQLGETELEAVKLMQENLLQYMAKKHDVSIDTHNLSVNTRERKLTITPREIVPEKEA